ncbi:MAG: CcmD family protein [Bacteroidota bacterium]
MDWRFKSENRAKQKYARRTISKRTITTFVLLLISSLQSFAQSVEMADIFRSNGKIYVVVAVVLIILVVLGVYLINLDSKTKKMEKRLKELLKNKEE